MKEIVILFTGTVASSLADKIISAFPKKEFNVSSVFTEKAKYFVDMDQLISKHFYIYSDSHEWEVYPKYQKGKPIPHIDFAKNGDVLLVISSADFLGKMANGLCDDLASSIYRAWPREKPVFVALAMNTEMWNHPITKEHLLKIMGWGVSVINPIKKKLACGEVGIGALEDVAKIYRKVLRSFENRFPLDCYKGIPVKGHPGSFLAKRKHDVHCGVDLYTADGEPVYAMNDGKIISIENFTGKLDNSEWWEDTKCILVEHWFGVVCYGEIYSHCLKVGDLIKKGQRLSCVKRVLKEGKERPDIKGHSLSMLHIELYPKGTKRASKSYAADKDMLLDPTEILIEANYPYHRKKRLLAP